MVLSIIGGRYRVQMPGCQAEASVRGRLKQDARRVLVGDHVQLAVSEAGVTIERIHERQNVLRRRNPGGGRRARDVAANVDQVIVVSAADQPPWNPYQVDRFLAVAEANRVPAVLVVNKEDLVASCDELVDPYLAAGYEVLLTSVPCKVGLSRLRETLTGKVSLLTGPSGVGKSSLLNALEPDLSLRTSEVSRRTRGGRHTTVAAEMHPLSSGGYVVDTPGLRDVGLWGLQPEEVQAAFPEVRAASRRCRFDDCRHLAEPDCAVQQARRDGKISESRVLSYERLLDEAMQAPRPWT